MHKNVFENKLIRVLDVHVAPGDTSLFHKHETPSVFIVLSSAKTGSEVTMEESKATALSKDASISFEGFYTKPRIHRVWNADSVDFHVMDVEILTKGHSGKESPVREEAFQLLFDEAPVRGYRLVVQAGKVVRLQRKAPYLIVSLTAAQNIEVNKTSLHKKGDYLFIPARQPIEFTNNNGQPHSFAVLELK